MPQPHLEDGTTYRALRPTVMDSNSGFTLGCLQLAVGPCFARSVTARVVQHPLGLRLVKDELSVLPSPFLRVNQT